MERSVPLEAGGPPITIRLSADLPGPEDSGASEAREREGLLSTLLAELDELIRSTPGLTLPPARAERSTLELIQAYHPRQTELVDLLAQEGELSGAEAERLREYLRQMPRPGTEERASAGTEARQPIAAAPLANDRTPTSPRPVGELLDRYEIKNLKQAGAVRARRQISFEEYMALKRHFAQGEAVDAEPVRPST